MEVTDETTTQVIQPRLYYCAPITDCFKGYLLFEMFGRNNIEMLNKALFLEQNENKLIPGRLLS